MIRTFSDNSYRVGLTRKCPGHFDGIRRGTWLFITNLWSSFVVAKMSDFSFDTANLMSGYILGAFSAVLTSVGMVSLRRKSYGFAGNTSKHG